MPGLTMSDEEMRGKLSPSEQAMLDEMQPKIMIPFRVTVSGHGLLQKQINILAPHSCTAVTMALELLFHDLDDVPAAALSIKVNVVKRDNRETIQ
ncbi:MAG: hypothetical protein ACYC0M_15435 [Burkholderiales bacterium]